MANKSTTEIVDPLKEEHAGKVREVGSQAIWSLSSCKPGTISIRAGTNFNDLQEVEVMDLNEPSGWVLIPVKDIHERPIRTFMIQIAVISNHQNGRDTHMRQIKIHSPTEQQGTRADGLRNFTTIAFQQYSYIR
ncbi:unnamed protein product [Timema podura]|uniref:Anaphase-promoting complex subunit 10 n=1 Tax=Timema podura TaxID=61482 RepID=A0ABN7PNK0_TIMPD|nr:unnamed protein product [Timema podura]